MVAQALLYSDLDKSLAHSLSVTLSGRWMFHKHLWGSRVKPRDMAACRDMWVRSFPHMREFSELEWYEMYNCLDVAGDWRLGVEQERLLSG